VQRKGKINHSTTSTTTTTITTNKQQPVPMRQNNKKKTQRCLKMIQMLCLANKGFKITLISLFLH
jgi:hypothetical protein